MSTEARQALVTTPTPLPFVALTPCRVINTRSTIAVPFPFPWGPPALVSGGAQRTFPIAGQCGVPADAQAVSANFTVVGATADGDLRVFPAGGETPTAATMAWTAPLFALSNGAAMPLGPTTSTAGFTVQLDSPAGLDLIVDINGYYSPVGVVNSLNGKVGDLSLVAGSNVTITPGAGTLSIDATGASGPAGATGATGPVGPMGPSGPAGGAAPSGSMLLGAPGDTTLIDAGYAEIAPSRFDYWTATTTTGVPSARGNHTAVWTGTRMIVWGGWSGGSSYLRDGGRYDPVANTWTATATTGAPLGRDFHTAVWTGTRMIVWGGLNGSAGTVFLNDGGQYDPIANTWTAATTAGAPSGRDVHTAVWTGSRMVVWGGYGGSVPLNDGGRYDPVADAWTATTPAGAPSARRYHTAVWTGSRMIVWGGSGGSGGLNDGGQYNPGTTPGTDSWSAVTTTNAPPGRIFQTAVWAGTKMIVWGGSNTSVLNDGGRYDPFVNQWTATTTAGAPAPRNRHTAVWTGSTMIVWGGNAGSANLNDGGQYEPITNIWTAPTTAGAPSARNDHTAVWTGSTMVVWGGYSGGYTNDGGQWRKASLYMKN